MTDWPSLAFLAEYFHLKLCFCVQVNSNDDKGVLYGRWDGKYEDGKKPTVWNGSVKILREWNNKGMAEVKYGQCWVFSGILTTG